MLSKISIKILAEKKAAKIKTNINNLMNKNNFGFAKVSLSFSKKPPANPLP